MVIHTRPRRRPRASTGGLGPLLYKTELHAPDALDRVGECRCEFGLQQQPGARGLSWPVVRLQKAGCFARKFEGKWSAVVAAGSAGMLAVALAHIASAADIEAISAFRKHVDSRSLNVRTQGRVCDRHLGQKSFEFRMQVFGKSAECVVHGVPNRVLGRIYCVRLRA